MPLPLTALLTFVCVTLLEVGWVVSVKLVQDRRRVAMVGSAMLMQGIVYVGLLAVVSDPRMVIPGILGAGLGAWIGMTVQWWFESQKDGPRDR